VKDFAEPLEDLNETPMLALGEIRIDDVVVEEFSTSARRYRQELATGTMDENGAQRADFRRDMNWHR